MNVILASASPRRREILEKSGFQCTICVPDILEERKMGETIETYIKRNVTEKAQNVFKMLKDSSLPLIAADTVVILGEELLEKPISESDAKSMIRRLSDKTHLVKTCFGLFRGDKEYALKIVTTEVTFRHVTASEIDWYIGTGEPFDKSGGYGIQGHALGFIESINGSYSNVMGLPMSHVWEEWEVHGFPSVF